MSEEKRYEKPKLPIELTEDEFEECHWFALSYAKQQGWFETVRNYNEILARDYGLASFERGLNIAVVTCKFWKRYFVKSV